ncbi:MAG: ABC transporter substrate-binding protein [Alteromonadaceae bacterium]|nr:ABC transporter substrate-binding protein [Alteromonadaceae bacterium]
MRLLITVLLALVGMGAKAAEDPPVLSISVLQFGTAHWELEHIRHQGLDRAHGYRLDLKPVANLPASRLAVTSGNVHGAVADLLWAQARHEAGSSFLYVPFSSQIGDIVVARDSDIHSVKDLAGRRIGVAGGPDSKGWILLREVARSQGIELADSAEVQFAAPPLLSQSLKRGRVDAIVTYWHFAARLKGEGSWRSAFAMESLLASLGMDTNLPVLGYVFPEAWAQEQSDLVDRFARSLSAAKTELAADPDHWHHLRALMRNPEDNAFTALRHGFIKGTPGTMTHERVADLQQLLRLTGAPPGKVMPADLFHQGAP